MPLPDITHLQFLVLDILGGAAKSGREVRAKLAEHGLHKSGPAFYQMMARLEDADFVEGWYEKKTVEGQTIKERRYHIKDTGAEAWTATRDFYVAAAGNRFVIHKGSADAT